MSVACRKCGGTGRYRTGIHEITCPYCNGWRMDFATPTDAESEVYRLKVAAASERSEESSPRQVSPPIRDEKNHPTKEREE